MVLAQQWESSDLSFTRFLFAKGFFLVVPLSLGKWSLQDVTYQPTQLHFLHPKSPGNYQPSSPPFFQLSKKSPPFPPTPTMEVLTLSPPLLGSQTGACTMWVPKQSSGSPLSLPPFHTLWPTRTPLSSSSVQVNELVFVFAACTLDSPPQLCAWRGSEFSSVEKGEKETWEIHSFTVHFSKFQIPSPKVPLCTQFRVLLHCFLFKAGHPHYLTFPPCLCLCSWPSNQTFLQKASSLHPASLSMLHPVYFFSLQAPWNCTFPGNRLHFRHGKASPPGPPSS